jgi:hypothetical protein
VKSTPLESATEHAAREEQLRGCDPLVALRFDSLLSGLLLQIFGVEQLE